MFGKYDNEVHTELEEVLDEGRKVLKTVKSKAREEIKEHLDDFEDRAHDVVTACKKTWNGLPTSTKVLAVVSGILLLALIMKGKGNRSSKNE